MTKEEMQSILKTIQDFFAELIRLFTGLFDMLGLKKDDTTDA